MYTESIGGAVPIAVFRKFVCSIMALFALIGCSPKRDVDVWKSSTQYSAVDKSRLCNITILCNDHVNKKEYYQDTIQVLDTYKENFLNIFDELRKNQFPIYDITCYNTYSLAPKSEKSLHSYSAAIDINCVQNPCVDVVTGQFIPPIDAPVNLRIRASDPNYSIENEDYFVNRNVIRPGMLTEKEIKIFAKNGFPIWGGLWKSPLDFMHFQTTKAIAKIVVRLDSKSAKIFWNEYLKDPEKISKDPFFANDIDENEIKLNSLLKKIRVILSRP